MAKCSACHREMLTADGCSYKHVREYSDNKKYKRIKVGDPGDPYEGDDSSTRCGDCGAKMGNYHHVYCDMEVSPRDYSQLLSSDVEYLK